MKAGLVLEGGGMRGVFTAGVLDYFMEKDLYLPYVVGVSAGACNGSSYVSRQYQRTKRVTIDYIDHQDYISFRNLIRKREFFGMDLLFRDIPLTHDPFDFETFFSSSQKHVVGVTDCHTGECLYYTNQEGHAADDALTQLRASCSIPYFSPVVKYNSHHLLDGGVADPIPIRKAEADGNKRNIVILTQHREYRKKAPGLSKNLRHLYKQYPNLVQVMLNRHNHYNETKDYVYANQQKEETFVIEPPSPLKLSRFSKDKKQLEDVYIFGYETAKQKYEHLQSWLH